jgi:hydrogenase expression/formation protein HypC
MCIAIPGRVTGLEDRQAQVDVLGTPRSAGIALYPDVRVGDYVLLNAGLIVEILDPDEALANLALLEELMALDEDRDPSGAEEDILLAFASSSEAGEP